MEADEVHLVNYPNATGIGVGLMLSFGDNKAQVKRRVRTLPNSHR